MSTPGDTLICFVFRPSIYHRGYVERHTSLRTMGLKSNHEKSRNPWPGHRWPATSSSLVCSRDLPACQHRSVLCPLGIPTHAINQPVLRCCRQSELVSHGIRTNAQFSSEQQFPFSPNLLFRPSIYHRGYVEYHTPYEGTPVLPYNTHNSTPASDTTPHTHEHTRK